MGQLIAFVAYSSDCLVQAELEVGDARLTDFLNAHSGLLLRDVALQAHDDGRTVRSAEIELSLDEIFAVEASDRPAGRDRRLRTQTQRTELILGPYHVLGELHGRPGGDPVDALSRRPTMIPLTAATIAFQLAGHTTMRDVGTLIVNRRLIDAIEVRRELSLALFDVRAPVDPRAKDLTWHIEQ